MDNKSTDTGNIFHTMTCAIAKKALERYELSGYKKDSEGFYICPECGTRASKISEHLGCMINCDCQCMKEKKQAEQREYEMKKCEQRRISCFESPRLLEHTFSKDNGLAPEISSVMRRYAENFPVLRKDGRGLVLFGSTGTGKSFFAACIANELTDKGYTVRQTTFSRLMSKMANTYDKQSVIDSYARADLVILDDVGTERGGDYTKQIMFDTVDTFYNCRTPMIVTTNLTQKEFREPKDKDYVRIYQRILEHCTWIKLENESQRVQNIVEGYNRDSALLGLSAL